MSQLSEYQLLQIKGENEVPPVSPALQKTAANAYAVGMAVGLFTLIAGVVYLVRSKMKWWAYLLLVLLIAPGLGRAAFYLTFSLTNK